MNEKLEKLVLALNEKKIEKKKKELEKEERVKKIKKQKEKEKKKIKARKKREKEKIKKRERELKKSNREKITVSRIIITSHNKVIKILGKFRLLTNAYKKYEEIVKNNIENVEFPVKYISNKNVSRQLCEEKYEILLVKTIPREESNETKLRDEFGRFITNKFSDVKRWAIIEKRKYFFEETFFVFGYNPRTDRKTFSFIFEKFLLNHPNDKHYFKRIVLYKNKLIFQYDNDIDIVVCKNKEDAIRLSNALEEKCKKMKIKNVLFSGFALGSTIEQLISDISKKTGWDETKIKRCATQT